MNTPIKPVRIPSPENIKAMERTHYPVREDEEINWGCQLFDSDGFPHQLIHLGGIQVVTKSSFAYAIWDRGTGALVNTDIQAGDGYCISNTPMSDEEKKKRRDAALEYLRNLKSAEGKPDVVGEQPKYNEDELYDVRVHHKDTVRLAVAYHQDGVWYEQGTNNKLQGRVELEDGSDGVMHKEPENPDDTLTDSWHIIDVRARDDASDFTDEQCREVLRRAKANLDRETGINYAVLDVHIDALIDEEAQAARNTSAPTNQG
jgi:hypothetical protein